MNSLWKDLLFLHGHLLHKEDLDWQPDAPAKPVQEGKNVTLAKPTVLACCAHVWPRIAGPR
ncbi:hypothetical protein [Rhodanobacter ginsengiterrae]|uniref:hypothetical protein n=1 Tax=Rhodanobacter ginsengiterrae TaxID=2008451 RepID=UPI003CE86DF7